MYEYTVQVKYGDTSVYLTVRSANRDWRGVEADVRALFPAATEIDAIRT